MEYLHPVTYLHPHRSAQYDSPLVSVHMFGNNDLAIGCLVEHHQASITRREIRVEGGVPFNTDRLWQCLDELGELVLHGISQMSGVLRHGFELPCLG
jgi:hypothetical protein